MKRKYTGWIPRFEGAEPIFKSDRSNSKPCSMAKYRHPRPCEVDGKICIFHRWADADEAVIRVNVMRRKDEYEALLETITRKYYIPPEASCDVIRRTVALVEYPDGSVGKVDPSHVTFLDKEVK